MRHSFPFTFSKIEKEYEKLLSFGYRVTTCSEYVRFKKVANIAGKIVVNRVDVALSCKQARIMATIFNRLNIKGSFFVRLHAHEYNPFSLENYRCLIHIHLDGCLFHNYGA